MQSKLLKIKLNPNSKTHLDKLITFMTANIELPKDEMKQKGYYWDSIFFEKNDEVEYLYLVLKSEDFSTIMADEKELVATPFREIYNQFKQRCWAPEGYLDIESIFCFNSCLTFTN